MPALATPAEGGAANDFVIVAGDSATGKRRANLVRIGPFYFWDGRRSRYANAVAAFGRPSGRRAEGNLCRVSWRDLGLSMGFVGQGCSGTAGAWYGASVSDRRWRTDRGLRVGDSVAQMRRLYPAATYRRERGRQPYWSLLRYKTDPSLGVMDTLAATVRDGRVVVIEIPAAYVF